MTDHALLILAFSLLAAVGLLCLLLAQLNGEFSR